MIRKHLNYVPYIIVLIVSLISVASSLAEETNKIYPSIGIMRFLDSSPEVMIVSPTLNEKKIEAGQVSCERKKSFLERHFNMKVRIVPDKKITDEEKKGVLIIVGKENALLKEIWDKTPIRPTPDSFFFYSEEYPNPRDSIMFTQVNPFNEENSILVCTSIDPDIDKISPITVIGSDWIIFRDLAIIRQGRFYGGKSLPPSYDGLAEFNNTDTFEAFFGNLSKESSDFYDINFPADLDGKERIAEGAKMRDAALRDILKKIGMKPPEKKFKIFLYKDQDQKKEFTGVPGKIHFMDGRKEIHMIADSFFAEHHHDDAHIVAGFILSGNASIHMTEGFAIFIDSQWKGKSLPYWSGFFLKLGKLPPLEELLDEGKFIKLASDYSYPLIGSVVTMLIEKHGIEKFKEILGMQKVTDDALKKAAGFDLSQLEAEWVADIKKSSAVHSKEIEFSIHNDVARECLEKKEYAAAVKELKKALEIIPDDPQTLFNCASASIRIPDLKAAEQVLLQLLNLNLPKSEQRFIVFGHYQLGRVYDLMDKRQKALAEYKKVLALPDMFDSHKQAKERLDRPATAYDFE